MFAVKNTSTGLYYTGKKDPASKWGPRCDAKWMGQKPTAKAVLGGLRNTPSIAAGSLRVVTIND